MELTNFIPSALGGGLFGLIGASLNRVFSFIERWQTHKYKLAEWQHELKLYELQRKIRQEEIEQEILLTKEEGSWQGLRESIRAEAEIGNSYLWVNAIRALIRPALTLLLLLISAGIWFYSKDQALLQTLSFNSSAVILWWFGDRAQRRNQTPHQPETK